MRRVGHKGADHIAPGDTFASFQAALLAGVDADRVVDVIAERGDGSGELLLAHDAEDAARRGAVHTLDEGLAHFGASGASYADVDFIVDLKGRRLRGAGQPRRSDDHGLAARCLLSTMEEPFAEAPARDASADPPRLVGPAAAARPAAQPADRRGPGPRPSCITCAVRCRSVAGNRIRRGEIDALMAHRRLATPRMARAIGDAGGELYVWNWSTTPRGSPASSAWASAA